MQVKREIGHAPRSHALAGEVSALSGGCVGCKSCTGLCTALIEALYLPGIVLKEKEA
ncbi:hypothetical protein [Sinisalibacter aestuarii]|uniref:4Fe-4S ferredoxin-type domain-containing protein n=1 Tax=Sinisalibacter aestuarii TaxID=2949426 RepID=A0ABQ5LSR9_9RHOB|nr:hypothetical protein [Sinisalibacter aestuarii]GKY88040.1 hypothetical protein STA1M1_19090 [Sinisalibacter aestuarii]